MRFDHFDKTNPRFSVTGNSSFFTRIYSRGDFIVCCVTGMFGFYICTFMVIAGSGDVYFEIKGVVI